MQSVRVVSLVLIGTVLGLALLYVTPAPLLRWSVGIMLFVGLGAYAAGYCLMRKRPKVAVALIWLGAPTAVAVIAVTVAVTTWLSTKLQTYLVNLPDGSALKRDADTVKGVLIGAVGAFAGSLYLDSAKEGGGPLWPAYWVKRAFDRAWKAEARRYLKSPNHKNEMFQSAVFLEEAGQGVSGWSWTASLRRLDMMDKYRKMPDADGTN